MKRQLYLYLFVCSALIASFTFMYYTKQLDHQKSISASNEKRQKDSINLLMNELNDANSFTLEKNEYAQNYFEGKDVTLLIPQIREALLAYNDSPEGNVYTGQEKLGVQKFIINKIKIVNHRWIVANYSDGTYWGDVMIKYFVEDNGKISFQIMDSFIYPKEEY